MKTLTLAAAPTAPEIFQALTQLAGEMQFPTKEYNEGVSVGGVYESLEQNHAMGDLVFVLNPKNKANFNVNVYAALFNSSKLDINPLKMITLPFTTLAGAPIVDADKTIGWLMSKDRIRFGWGEKTIEQSYSPNGGFLDTFGNVSAAMGHVPYHNFVKIVLT